MSKQQEANAHGQPREGQPLLYKRRGPAARQALLLPPVQPTPGEPRCTASLPAWKHLGHSETEELIKVQQGQGSNTCSDLFRGLDLRENRSLKPTLRTTKWLGGCQETEAIRRPAQQIAPRKQLCPEDEEALVDRLRQRREQLEELEDKLDEVIRDIFSSLDNNKSCLLSDPPSPTLEPAPGPSALHSPCSATKDAAGETPKHSELVSLDQLLAELCPVPDDSLSCDSVVKERLENWEQEELPDREAAGERDSELESVLCLLAEKKEGCVLRDRSSVTLELAAGSQVPHSTSGITSDSAGEAETSAEMAAPDLLADPCCGNSLSCDALVNELLEKWQEEMLPEREAAGERDSEPESEGPLQPPDEGAEAAASEADSGPCSEGHSEPLPTALPEEAKGFMVCSSPAEAVDEADTAGMDAGHAQGAPPEEKPCGAEPPAEACPEPAQPLARSVPACPAGSAAVPQPPAPGPWRSMVKTARRALRRLFSFSCLRGQPEE